MAAGEGRGQLSGCWQPYGKEVPVTLCRMSLVSLMGVALLEVKRSQSQ